MSAVRKNPQEEAYFHKLNQELLEKMREKSGTTARPTATSTGSNTSDGSQGGKVLTFDPNKRRAR